MNKSLEADPVISPAVYILLISKSKFGPHRKLCPRQSLMLVYIYLFHFTASPNPEGGRMWDVESDAEVQGFPEMSSTGITTFYNMNYKPSRKEEAQGLAKADYQTAVSMS